MLPYRDKDGRIYGPPPTPESVQAGFEVLGSTLGCVWTIVSTLLVIGGIGAGSAWLFGGIAQHNALSLIIMAFLCLLLFAAIFWSRHVMKRTGRKAGCVVFMVLCILMLVASVGVSIVGYFNIPVAGHYPAGQYLGFYARESWTGQSKPLHSSGAPISIAISIQSIDGNDFQDAFGDFQGTFSASGKVSNIDGTLGRSVEDFPAYSQSVQDVINTYGSGDYMVITQGNFQLVGVLKQDGELKGFFYVYGGAQPQTPLAVAAFDLQKTP